MGENAIMVPETAGTGLKQLLSMIQEMLLLRDTHGVLTVTMISLLLDIIDLVKKSGVLFMMVLLIVTISQNL